MARVRRLRSDGIAGNAKARGARAADLDVRNIAMVHRLGRVEVGEISVAVAVGSPHREAAFAAAKWLIDELKRQVPIWKKECYSQGDSEWVEGSFAPSCSACHGTDDSA